MDIPALQAYFWDQATIPQKFGTHDCVTFVVGAVYAGWNRDYRDILQYSDRRTAVDRLRELGGLRGACEYAMGDMYPVNELHPGDVIWFPRPDTIGLLMPEYVAVKLGGQIHRLHLHESMRGWKTAGGPRYGR